MSGVSAIITGNWALDTPRQKIVTWFLFVNPVMTTTNLKEPPSSFVGKESCQVSASVLVVDFGYSNLSFFRVKLGNDVLRYLFM